MNDDSSLSQSERDRSNKGLTGSPGIHERMHGLQRRVAMLLALYVVGLVAWVAAVDALFLWLTGTQPLASGNLWMVGILLTLVLGATAYQWWRLSRDGAEVARLLGGTPVSRDPADAKLRRLRQVLDEIAIAAAMPAPALFVLPSERAINAFAAGVDQERSAIAVSQGALDRLSRSELQAVVAHELAHVRHGDTLVSMRLCAMNFGLMALTLLGVALMSAGGAAARQRSKDSQQAGAALFLSGLATAICGGIGWTIARVIEAATSRDQELRADAQAVRWMGETGGMVGVLVKLAEEQRLIPAASVLGDNASLYRGLYLRDSARSGWFDSHPPLLKRIEALDPQALFDLEWRR
jgi:Zn-dependent protease with chaperone function